MCLNIASVISLLLLMGNMIFIAASNICVEVMSELHFEISERDICHNFDLINISITSYNKTELRYTMILMLPVVTYFMLNEPHDCYMCYGKDPDRVYSSFQLSLEDRAKRHFRARFNVDFEKV